MPDAELETPANVDIDDVDPDDPTYRRIVAVLVVLITLFGSIVAYLQAVESNAEDVAARDAQRQAIAGLGSQVDASAGLAADVRIGSELDANLQLQALNAARVNALGEQGEADVHLAAAERHAAVREAIADLTPVDPSNPATIDDDIARSNESPDAARLRQFVEADKANDHGSKADSYVAVLTVLAVALFLIGLSLTVHGRSRLVLVAPGVVVAIACVGWVVLINGREVTTVSDRAVQAAAEGARLQGAGDLEGAIEAFDEAIEDSPEFAAAYARRADARFLQGSDQIGQQGFLSITDEDALEDALDDLDRAFELGADTDVVPVADAGFFHFLAGDFDRSVELSSRALELNDQLATVWFNLGVAELARGNEREGTRAYREGRQLLEDVPDAATRQAVLAGARTDLSVLRELLDGDDLDDVEELIQAVEGELAAFDASFVDVPCDLESCPDAGEVDADDIELTDAVFTRDGALVFADYTASGVEPGTALTNVWYVRTDDERPFEQTALPTDVVRVGDDSSVSTLTLPSGAPACPVAGQYLLRVYAGDQLVGELDTTIDPSPFGTEFTSVVDPIEGYEACVPVDFDVQRADVGELDAFTGFNGVDVSYGLNVTPGVLQEGFDENELLEAVLTGTLQIQASELQEVTLNGFDLEGNFVGLPGLAGSNVVDGVPVMSAVAFGPDGASRNVTVTGTDDFDLMLEAIGLVQFTNLPVAE